MSLKREYLYYCKIFSNSPIDVIDVLSLGIERVMQLIIKFFLDLVIVTMNVKQQQSRDSYVERIINCHFLF